MLSLLNLIAIFGAVAAGVWQARLITANKPIRHGRWLAAYIAIGYGSAFVAAGPWWGILALVGMAGMFSLWFRLVLNLERGLLPSYMGPDPAVGSAGRSKYDLLCWRFGAKLQWPPVLVAMGIEVSAVFATWIIFLFLHP